jgi:hypothetical protein
MFTTEDYLYGWLLYIAAGLVFFACWWYLTAKIKTIEIRAVLRTGAAVTMFVPWYTSPDMDYLAPAVLMAAMEGIFDGNGAFWRAGTPLLIALAVGIAGSLIYAVVRRVVSGKSETEASEKGGDDR